ncbi:cation-transporting P-type ATPase, partial [Vagococcus fluvialis]
MPVDDLLRSFNSSQKGLTNQQASESREKYGEN